MKKIYKLLTISFLLLLQLSSVGQIIDRTIICQTDTFVVPVFTVKYTLHGINDSFYTYKAFMCSKITNTGLRLDVGVSQYFYNESTADWLGNHFGPSFGIALLFKNWNIGARFKPATINPEKNLVFNERILINTAKLNPVKFDYYVGYTHTFGNSFSVDPYIGYSQTIFNVINEELIGTKFAIPESSGFIFGLSLNKYFKLKGGNYFGVCLGIGQSLVDYSTTHSSLGIGYFEYTAGISYKGFFKRELEKRIK